MFGDSQHGAALPTREQEETKISVTCHWLAHTSLHWKKLALIIYKLVLITSEKYAHCQNGTSDALAKA